MATYNIMIINNKNKSHTYAVEAVKDDVGDACLGAIEEYVKKVLKFEHIFSITEAFWTTVKTNLASDLNIRVQLVNGFCRDNDLCIKSISVVDEKYPTPHET